MGVGCTEKPVNNIGLLKEYQLTESALTQCLVFEMHCYAQTIIVAVFYRTLSVLIANIDFLYRYKARNFA